MEQESPLALMGTDALEIQTQASRAIYLLRAIDGLVDELGDRETKEQRLEVIDAIIVFTQMAEEAAKAAKDVGERIEARSTHMRRVGS